MSFLDNYEPVADRIAKFWERYPEGRLHTEIVLINETEVVIKASAFTNRDDTRPAAIDFAQETRGSSSINKQNFIENCSTSALGRCLATLGFQPKKDNGKAVRPSREEMKKAVTSESVAPKPTEENLETQLTLLSASGDLLGLRKLYKENSSASPEFLERVKKAAESLK